MQEKKDRRIRGLEEDYLYNKVSDTRVVARWGDIDWLQDTTTVSFSDFINKELVLFSNTDNERSIPCLVDGFKPGQRKVRNKGRGGEGGGAVDDVFIQIYTRSYLIHWG